MNFSKQLIQWYLQNDRQLPWRSDTTPYKVWLSEIILQQTRVAQGTPYYFAFTEAFPTVFDLANAEEQTVLKLWQGLGYYSRARNLHFAAKQLVANHNGIFPKSYTALCSLKGVGDYTASAIASICFDLPHAVVDGNVYRVLARYFGVDTPINSSKGIAQFKQLAQDLLDHAQPGTHNQAIMDFGALHCKPKKPLCETCPLASSCAALQSNKVDQLPVKEKKLRIKHRFFNYIVPINQEGKTQLQLREGKGIWQGLYEFPLVETNKSIGEKELLEHPDFKAMGYTDFSIALFTETAQIHKLSHQHLHTHFWIINSTKDQECTVSFDDLAAYPVPVLISNFIEQFKKSRY